MYEGEGLGGLGLGGPNDYLAKREREKVMTAIIVKIELEGDARKFIEGLLEDYYYSIKGNADLLAQYETLTYEISEGK
jgi:hypothetical protein